MVPVNMPQIGENIEVGTIVRWHKREGDTVSPGEVILTVESEKASFDVEAERSGVLLKTLYREGEQAAVLAPVAYLGEPGETVSGADASQPGGETGTSAAAAAPGYGGAPTASLVSRGGRPYASPSARRVAAERGVSLEGIVGSGPGGRIVKQDVLAAPAARAREDTGRRAREDTAGRAPEDTVVPLEGVRRVAAERLSLSSRTIPHFYVFQDVDMGAALALRDELNRGQGGHVTVTDLVAHAAVQALRAAPGLNAHVDDQQITLKGRVQLGIAVASERGLVVPVVADADALPLPELARRVAEVVAAARRGRLDPAARGSFTVTSLGMFGVPAFLPLINPPECAILGVGAVQERVSARGGWIGVRPVMTVVLGCDHRAVDGAEAARYLGQLKERLEERPGVDGP